MDLLQSLVNSGIFTGGVLLGTVVFGVLAGYALARLHYRGRGTLFAVMLLVQTIPFQLLIIPIYVMIVRTYGLADSYLGMIVAVRDQLHGGVHLPAVLPAAARGAVRGRPRSTAPASCGSCGRLRCRWSARPCSPRCLLTFIGPWNEFLWPFLVTKEADMQPLAVSLANYISNVAGRAANPYGAILAGAVVLSVPAVALFVAFQKHFTASDLGSGVKG